MNVKTILKGTDRLGHQHRLVRILNNDTYHFAYVYKTSYDHCFRAFYHPVTDLTYVPNSYYRATNLVHRY